MIFGSEKIKMLISRMISFKLKTDIQFLTGFFSGHYPLKLQNNKTRILINLEKKYILEISGTCCEVVYFL